jgi:hypothetical protein
MANMTGQTQTPVENPEQETTSAQSAAVSSSQKVSRRGIFNFRRL